MKYYTTDPNDRTTLEADYAKALEFRKTIENKYFKAQVDILVEDLAIELEEDWDNSQEWDESDCYIDDGEFINDEDDIRGDEDLEINGDGEGHDFNR